MRRRHRKTEQVLQLQDPAPHKVWGAELIDPAALDQMRAACQLPITVSAAQMPDGHVGYGLPIGGVLATRNAVIPYAVGVDIACRMKMSVMDIHISRITDLHESLTRALRQETRFGMGTAFEKDTMRQHAVMEDAAWDDLPRPLAALKNRAWSQLGTSGSGNHFVEWGQLTLEKPELGLPAGDYLALLSHSGSRGFGSQVAKYFTDLAMEKTPLPEGYRALAWLDLQSAAGQEYWLAMELAGRYAAANHDLIHRHVLRAAGLEPFVQVENHHNFAWKEEHRGERVIVHRKGATPAGEGVLGIIPGSMGDPGYVVCGKGNRASLNSAAHGAGRALGRRVARQTLSRQAMKEYLIDRGVELLAGGLDEAPMAYKPIDAVMAAQEDLVEVVGKFWPRIVLMADDGTAED